MPYLGIHKNHTLRNTADLKTSHRNLRSCCGSGCIPGNMDMFIPPIQNYQQYIIRSCVIRMNCHRHQSNIDCQDSKPLPRWNTSTEYFTSKLENKTHLTLTYFNQYRISTVSYDLQLSLAKTNYNGNFS